MGVGDAGRVRSRGSVALGTVPRARKSIGTGRHGSAAESCLCAQPVGSCLPLLLQHRSILNLPRPRKPACSRASLLSPASCPSCPAPLTSLSSHLPALLVRPFHPRHWRPTRLSGCRECGTCGCGPTARPRRPTAPPPSAAPPSRRWVPGPTAARAGRCRPRRRPFRWVAARAAGAGTTGWWSGRSRAGGSRVVEQPGRYGTQVQSRCDPNLLQGAARVSSQHSFAEQRHVIL